MGVKDLFKLTNMEALDKKYSDLLQNGIKRIGIDMYVLLHKSSFGLKYIICSTPYIIKSESLVNTQSIKFCLYKYVNCASASNGATIYLIS